jgi:hypothetical protein
MGLASLGGIFGGAGNVGTPSAQFYNRAYTNLMNTFAGGVGTQLSTQQQYGPQFNALALSNLGTTTSGLAGMVSGLLPQANAMVRGVSPGQTSLLDNLTQSANQQLASGAALDPALARVTQQSIRGSQAARGLGYGPSDVLQESTALTSLGDQLRQERQGFASNVAGMNNQFETQPTLALLNNLISQGGTLNATSAPNLISPTQAGQFLTMPYQTKAQANAATAANTTGLYQTMDNNSNSFISGL